MAKKATRGNRGRKKGSPKNSKLWSRLTIWGVKFLGFCVSALVVFFVVVYLGLFGKIPGIAELSAIRNHDASVVFSADGVLIGKIFLQNRQTISVEKIPEHLKNALVATEDSRFFNHGGIDLRSIGRVVVRTIILGERDQGGGSTIGQQLARNLFPRRDLGFLSLPVNKAREIFIAYRLERIYTKEEILALYLNTVPFGEEVFGIEAAAQRFFGKPSSRLTVPEAATLIGMLAANTTYSPRLNPDLSLQRRNVVIQRMATNGFITADQAETFAQTPLRPRYTRIDRHHGPAPYFLEQVRIEAEEIIARELGNRYNIYTDGLRIYTTLDATLQGFAVSALRGHMATLQAQFNKHWSGVDPWHGNPAVFTNALHRTSRYRALKEEGLSEKAIMERLKASVNTTIFTSEGERRVDISPIDSLRNALRTLHAGFVAINPANGHVLAWEGGINFRFFQFDHVTSRRQAGSTFKPIVYATALNKGYNPCEFISNEQRVYPRYDNWSPANADGKHEGYYSIKGGLIHSSNTIAAELINQTGVNDVIQMARQMGINSPIPNVPSIALGTANLSLLELTAAYTAFANYGRAVEPVILLRIEDKNGNILYQRESPKGGEPAFNEETARLMVHIMRETVLKGTGRSLYERFNLQGDYGGKTGTTQNNADGWFIGFSPTIVAGSWVGAENPAISFRTLALGQGANTALPIFARFMQQAEKSPRHAELRTQRFYPLPDDMIAMIDCADFADTKPREDGFDFFRRIFESEEGQKTRPEGRDKNIFERARDIFKREN